MQLTKISTSRISWNGPPFAVSSKSHFKISSLGDQVSGSERNSWFGHVLLQANLTEQINCTASTPSEGADDQSLDALSGPAQLGLDILHHRGFVLVGKEPIELCAWRASLGSEGQYARCSAGKASMESERGYAPAGVVLEKLEVVQAPATLAKTVQNLSPARLVLVAVCKLDVRVKEWFV